MQHLESKVVPPKVGPTRVSHLEPRGLLQETKNRRENSMSAIQKIKPDHMDLNNDAFRQSRGYGGRPVDWKISDKLSQ